MNAKRSLTRHLFSAVATALVVATAWGSPGIALGATVTDRGALRTNLDNYSGWYTNRDCGWSEPLATSPGSSLWVFCDSDINGPNNYHAFYESTSASGPDTPGTAPTLVENGPYGVPAQFLPASTSTSSCTRTPRWASGMILLAFTTKIMIPYVVQCVNGLDYSTSLRFGITEYDASTNQFVSAGTNDAIFQAASLGVAYQLGSPAYYNGFYYFYGSHCDSSAYTVCTSGRVLSARVAVGSNGATTRPWLNPMNYQWWDGSKWQSNVFSAQSIIAGITPVGDVSVDWYPQFGKYLLVEQTDGVGRFRVWQSSDPGQGWTVRASGQVPNCQPNSKGSLCRALIGHPELSTSTQLAISFFHPSNDVYNNRIRVATMPLN